LPQDGRKDGFQDVLFKKKYTIDKVQEKEILSVWRHCFGLMNVFSCRTSVGPGNGSYFLFMFYLTTGVRSMIKCSYTRCPWIRAS